MATPAATAAARIHAAPVDESGRLIVATVTGFSR
jgi:hypothetical protein